MQQPDNPCIIMANEPRAYREVMAATFRALRPHLAIATAEPDELGRELVGPAGCTRRLVVHSRRTATVPDGVAAWVLLYPDGDDTATVSIAGRQTTTPHAEMDDLLAIFDRFATLPEAAPQDAAFATELR